MIKFVVEIHNDYDVKPTDFDCYSPADIKAWENGEWHYVGAALRITRERMVGDVSVEETFRGDALWGIDLGGDFGGSHELLEYALSQLDTDAICEVAGIPRAEANWQLHFYD